MPAKRTIVLCRKCRQLLPRDAFQGRPAPGNPGGIDDMCRDCRDGYTRNAKPNPDDPSGTTLLIPLSRGMVAIVDEDRVAEIAQHRWYAQRGQFHTYAARVVYEPGTLKRTLVLMHREILGVPLGAFVDHINRNSLDNRIGNLREVSNAENQANRCLSRANTSGYVGVTWHRRNHKWMASLTSNKQTSHLGYFTSPEDAAHAVDNKAREIRGPVGRYNFPRPGERPARE